MKIVSMRLAALGVAGLVLATPFAGRAQDDDGDHDLDEAGGPCADRLHVEDIDNFEKVQDVHPSMVAHHP